MIRAIAAVVVPLAIVLGSVPLRAAETTVPLPVRKVMLFKNGIGYFEHAGEVRGTDPIEIVLPGEQLNDVLKSLTVIDGAPSQVTGVTYESAIPVERRLAELPVKLGSARDLVGFLNQLRGAEVEVLAPGGAVKGRVMGAEIRKSPSEAALRQRYVRQLEEQEQKLGELRAERERLRGRRIVLQREVEELIQALTFDRRP